MRKVDYICSYKFFSQDMSNAMKHDITSGMIKRGRYTLLLSMMLLGWASGFAQDLQTGEWATLEDGTPLKVGQTTNDHVFARNAYDDNGVLKTYDNLVSFKSGALQTVWLWLDDDEIYLNEKVQALPKTLIKDYGTPYNEITYNAWQCNIYLPEGIRMVKAEDENGNEISFVQGDRLPNSAIFRFADNISTVGTKVIDGVRYHPYTIVITNTETNGTHFSAKNAVAYQNHGALKKDDAPLVAIFLENENQRIEEGQLADMIIANQEFGLREPFMVDPQWTPNDYRFIYGEGGNNETQRYQLYNRVALYGSLGINNIDATGITLNTTTGNLNVGETLQLTATITPSDATIKTVDWISSNTGVATVDDNGLVRAIAPGSATITATTTDGTELSASCQVTVVQRVEGITLNETSLTLTLPETAQLYAQITPSNATNQTVTWTSSNSAIARVDNNGLVTSVAQGTATIRATTTDGSHLTASCVVTVRRQLVTSITLSESSMVMNIGETSQLSAEITPENASNKTVAWRSGNTSVATVNNEGLVTAVGVGTTYVSASTIDGSHLTATCTIEVLPDYTLSLDTISYVRGSDDRIMDLQVSLTNRNPVSGIQFNVALPAGMTMNLVDGMPDVWLDEARRTPSHNITASQLGNGNYRVVVSSSTAQNLKGDEGVLVHMNLLLPQQYETGEHMVNVSNIIVTGANSAQHHLDNVSTIVRYKYIVGDADANAAVDVADYTSTASKIMGKSPSPFYNDAADVDGNNSLNVIDLVGITNISLEIDPIIIRQAPERIGQENRLFCDKLDLMADGEREINIGMDCGFDFAGFQMDVSLPDGLKLVRASLGQDAAQLGLATEMLPDGTIRILGTSFSDAVVNGVCPELLRLSVKADRGLMLDSRIGFKDILFAERNLTAHALDDLSIEYVEPSAVYEMSNEAKIYVENGSVIVDTPVAGTVQLIGVDGRMVKYHAQIGHNVYQVPGNTIYIIHFNGKTLKVRL